MRLSALPVRVLAASACSPIGPLAARRAIEAGNPLQPDGRRPAPMSAATGWCSARSRSICSRCCSAGRPRCCRSSRATSSRSAPRARAAPRRARGRRDADCDLLLLPAAQDQCRGQDAGRGRSCSARRRSVFGLSRIYPLSLALLALLGAADMFSVYIRQSLIQLHTPDEMRGRVAAVSTLAISASNELGETRSGFTAALLGPVAAAVGRRHRRDRRRRCSGRWLFPNCAAPARSSCRAAARGCRDRRRRLTATIGLEGDAHEGQQHPRDHRQHAAHPHQPPVRRRAEVWIKSERANPGASIKDRIALAMVEDAERSGKLKPGGDDRRADQRQHRHRPGDGRRGQGLPTDPGHARQHERSSAAA